MLELIDGVSGGDLSTDSSFSLRDHRIGEADHVDAFGKHRLSYFSGPRGIADHHGNDGVDSVENIETELLHFGSEELGVRFESISQFGGSL